MGFWLVTADHDSLLDVKLLKTPPPNSRSNAVTNNTIDQIEAYFNRNLRQFNINYNMSKFTTFQKTVWMELQKIKFGTTISYQELAIRLGNPKCIRAAASANGKNPFPLLIPCHRVIGKDGSLTGYALGLNVKEQLLRFENALPSKQMTLF